jgi:hypothetical protein
MQVVLATQTVPPVHPWPPHCPHFCTVPPGDEVEPPEPELVVEVPGMEVVLAVPEYVGTTDAPVGVSGIASSARTHPDLAVSAAGHSTCLNVTDGLSAFWNQSNRQ